MRSLCLFRLALPDGFALFQERSEALFEVWCATDARVLEDGPLEILVDAGRRRGGHQAFCTRKAPGARRNQYFGKLLGTGQQVLCWNNLVNQAELLCFVRFKNSPSKQEVAGLFLADLARKEHGNERREKTDAHFGIAKSGVRHSQRKIAQRRYSAATCKSGTINGGDERPWKAPDSPEHLGHAPRIFLVFSRRLLRNRGKHVQIHAGAERFARSGENSYAGMALFDFIERRLNLRNHGGGHGVAFFRAVQRDGC